MINILRFPRFLSHVALCALFVCSTCLSAAERMAAGKWEFVMTTDGHAHTMSQCITAEKASQFNGDSKYGREQAEKDAKGRCTINTYEIAGDTVSYSMTCGATQIDSVTTFHGDTSDGSLVSTSAGKSFKTQVKARRLGACP
jgi:hypothetical protein